MRDFSSVNSKNKCFDCGKKFGNFFCNLSEETRKSFESLLTTNYYVKGSRIFVEGQPSNGVYIICRGSVKLSTCSKDGKVIILHIAKPGEVLGLSATISNSVQTETAEVLEPCNISFVNGKDFLRFLETNAEVCLNAVKQLSNSYQTACLQICALGLSASVSDKLATLFIGWCRQSKQNGDGFHLEIPYTHEDIAQMIGTSRETVTRILKSFRERNLVTRNGSKLIIPDKSKLESIIGTRQRAS